MSRMAACLKEPAVWWGREANELANTIIEYMLNAILELIEGVTGAHEKDNNPVWDINTCQTKR